MNTLPLENIEAIDKDIYLKRILRAYTQHNKSAPNDLEIKYISDTVQSSIDQQLAYACGNSFAFVVSIKNQYELNYFINDNDFLQSLRFFAWLYQQFPGLVLSPLGNYFYNLENFLHLNSFRNYKNHRSFTIGFSYWMKEFSELEGYLDV